jgi:peptidylprolyl isomerase
MNAHLAPRYESRFVLARRVLAASWLLACARPATTADDATGAAAGVPGAALPLGAAGASTEVPAGATLADVLASAKSDDFRSPDPENTLYLELDSGRVVLLLAPEFAPRHVANVKALVREGYFDGTAIVRVHENYVVQWADPDGKRAVRTVQRTLPAEFDRPAAGLPFTPLAERDTSASEVGFTDGFPAARESVAGAAWLVHCYQCSAPGVTTQRTVGEAPSCTS